MVDRIVDFLIKKKKKLKEVKDMAYTKGISLRDWALMDGNTVGKEVLDEWDFEENVFKLKLTPRKITYASSKEVYWRCLNCGQLYKARVSQKTLNHRRCPYCNDKKSGTSLPEQQLYSIFKSLFSSAINRDRHLGFELDIYIPEINLAIEYNGSYYHKILHDSSKRDQMKKERCQEEGIFLIQVWDDGDSKFPVMSDDCKSITFKYYAARVVEQMNSISELIIKNILSGININEEVDIESSEKTA